MMSDEGIFVCASAELLKEGRGVRFPVTADGEDATGFVVRHDGELHAYLNRCSHLPLELDQGNGKFFDSSGHYLMCSRHGATYLPANGRCAGGPCSGGQLRAIRIAEINGWVVWFPDEHITAVRA